MLKGRYTALSISVFAHIILLLVLVFFSVQPPLNPKEVIKKTAIKSYIYHKAKPVIKTLPEQPIIKEPIKALLEEVKAIAPVKKIEEKSIETVKAVPVVNNKLPAKINKPSKDDTAQKKLTAPALPTSLPVRPIIRSSSLSSHQSLSRLRNSIDQQLANDFFSEQTQTRSASKMHGAQLPVPHSEVALTAEEKHHKNTSRTHAHAITKNDDGTCTIVREQVLGSPVEASVSGFACGESKFDKSFRQHMKAVNKKFMNNQK